MSGPGIIVGVVQTGFCKGKPIVVHRRCGWCLAWTRKDTLIEHEGVHKVAPGAYGECRLDPKVEDKHCNDWCMRYTDDPAKREKAPQQQGPETGEAWENVEPG